MCCYHLLCADMISFFIIRKCLKIRYLTKIVKLRKKHFKSPYGLDEFQRMFWVKCNS